MNRARGFTLLETLIALVVLSVGMLGATAMLLESLHSHAQALRAVAATDLVRDLAERIRANPSGGVHYDTRFATAGSATCDAGNACDAAQLASVDLAHFSAAVHRALPRADTATRIEFEPATGPAEPDRYLIALRWYDTRDADDGRDPLRAQEVALQVLSFRAGTPVAG